MMKLGSQSDCLRNLHKTKAFSLYTLVSLYKVRFKIPCTIYCIQHDIHKYITIYRVYQKNSSRDKTRIQNRTQI